MTDLERLVDALRASSPDLDLTLDWSGEPEAPGWLGVAEHGRFVAVEWRLRLGFGVSLVDTSSDPAAGLFEGPEEVFSDFHAAKERILQLLGSEGRHPRDSQGFPDLASFRKSLGVPVYQGNTILEMREDEG